MYARDIQIRDDYLVASADLTRTFPDFLKKFRVQTGGVCCGPPILVPGKKSGHMYYSEQHAEVDKVAAKYEVLTAVQE